MENKEVIINALLGKSTVKRRKAAIAIYNSDGCFCTELAEALKIELETKRNWKTQLEIVKSIGIKRCSSSESILRSIVFSLDIPEYDLVKLHAATALVRVSRSGLDDYNTVKEIISNGGYSAKEGALSAIGYDRMIFVDDECNFIIENCWDFGKDRSKGYTDPRYGLAAACAGWSGSYVYDFLNYCLESSDVPLKHVTENSLKKKYVKLR